MNIRCFVCKIDKDILEFVKNSKKKNGVLTICKNCFKLKYRKSKEERKKYYIENSEKWNEYYIDNKEKISDYKKEYRKENLETIKKKQKKYVEINKNILKPKWKKYREENRERSKEYSSNPENKLRRNNNRNNRKRIDHLYNITLSIRKVLYSSFKSSGFTKRSNTQQIIGCSFIEFKKYLESKFEPWMTWENKGLYNGELNHGWDIDHIIPTSSAKTEEEVVKLNHYTNLQPLCSKINRDIKKNFF
jgi:hypothetical protein